jgi:hypothetical protein
MCAMAIVRCAVLKTISKVTCELTGIFELRVELECAPQSAPPWAAVFGAKEAVYCARMTRQGLRDSE